MRVPEGPIPLSSVVLVLAREKSEAINVSAFELLVYLLQPSVQRPS